MWKHLGLTRFLGVLLILLIALKLLGVINAPWWVVLIPLWVGIAIAIGIAACALAVLSMASTSGDLD